MGVGVLVHGGLCSVSSIISPRVVNLTAPFWSLTTVGTPRMYFGPWELRTSQMESLLLWTKTVPTGEGGLVRKLYIRILKSETETWLQIRELNLTNWVKTM